MKRGKYGGHSIVVNTRVDWSIVTYVENWMKYFIETLSIGMEGKERGKRAVNLIYFVISIVNIFCAVGYVIDFVSK